jgi:GR25 family glycosyltransferase involved in LPS biosynthesis
MLRNFHDITNVLFINLDSRTDRRTHFELQFSEIGFHPQRFAAIQNARGAIGCTMSHIACMETAIQNNWDHVLVCEDDATIISPDQLVHQVNHFFQRFNDSWDVLLLAGNNYQPFRQESSEAVRVANCQTTTAYLVRRPYFETLLANFKEGLSKLKAIDQYWKLLQRTDRWYLIVPISVIQRSDFSDISKRHVDYSDVMTQINKKRNRHVVRKLVVPVKSRLRKSIKNGIGGENVWFM